HDVLAAVEEGLDDISEAVVVSDARDRVAFATRAGRAALELMGGGGDRLPEALRNTPAPAHAVVPVEGGPLMVRRMAPRGGATVFMFERGSRGAPLSLLESLGLTPREAEVLQAMMRGQATAAIAGGLGVSPRTVHK
ncbi:hypothetical protein G3N28_23315, partial [Desulfobacter hydrogenophilus]|uniref:helix-turn-helix transcriptional regulator n=1 Tax=Desulfobacter hydrogenophilus TaxID=2291 RepID=UPI0013FC07C1